MNTRSSKPVSLAIRRKSAREERKQRILVAAEFVFGSRGFHEASLTEIASLAGFAVGTIYLYFEDKADLYGSLILEKMKQMVGGLEQALNREEGAGDSLRGGVHAQFAFHDANRTFFEIFLQQHQVQTSPLHDRHWKEMEKLKRRNLSVIEKCILRGQKRGEIQSGDPQLFAVAFLGITLQMIRQWIREKSPGRLVDSADFAANCFLHGAASRVPAP